MVAVRPDSIAVVFDPQHRPRIWFPGEMLKPGLFPGLHPLQVVALTTGPVSLDVTVGPLTTVDGQALEHAKIRVVVQLNDERPLRHRGGSGRRRRPRPRGPPAATGPERGRELRFTPPSG